ncbi:MAG: DUF2225 domain-containing protein, partial [Chitinivibrionales bacterium]
TVECPVCRNADISSYQLKSKSQKQEYNHFLVPEYMDISTGLKSHIDYKYLAVTVCNKCLFASPDIKDFNRTFLKLNREEKSETPIPVIRKFPSKKEKLRAIVCGIEAENRENYFNRPRDYNAAVTSYLLSLVRAEVETEVDIKLAYYKMGAYMLKIAAIKKNEGIRNITDIETACKYMEDAYQNTPDDKPEILARVVYLSTALNMALGRNNKARQYLQLFTKIKKSEMNTSQKTDSTLNKWENKSRNLWEDRERGDLFRDEIQE